MSITLFTLLAFVTITLDVIMIVGIFTNRKDFAFSLSGCFISSIGVTLAYIFTLIVDDYFLASVVHSLHFISIDCLLNFTMAYIIEFTTGKDKSRRSLHQHLFISLIRILAAIDIAILLINPFKEISISFTKIGSAYSNWKYEPFWPFNLHLGLCYVIILFTIVHLIISIKKSPTIYTRKFIPMIIGILLIVAMNALFLFALQGKSVDFSILFYSAACFIFYKTNDHYSKLGIINLASQLVIENLDIPMILFDNNNMFSQTNPSGNFLVKDLLEEGSFSTQNFIDRWNLSSHVEDLDMDTSFQWEYKTYNTSTIYRVDYVILRSKKKKNRSIIGRVFMLTEYSMDSDLLTGFHTEYSLRKYIELGAGRYFEYPAGIAICDLNRLSEINTLYGKDTGDNAIKYLADAIKEFTPPDSHYFRLNDAILMFVCQKTSVSAMRNHIDCITRRLDSIADFPIPLKMQSAVTIATEANPDIQHAINSSFKSMKAKKMMDVNSAHSSLLDSIAQILQESDQTTNEHVKRTQIMGEKLGIRLGLSDYDLSNLALLCLLHDIGKLGIPLEILNKPAKLSNEEWDVMKSHAIKGYKIAKASEELEDIADLILHHHECWNGKGYPDGLSGESIPLLSRIIAVVDTYDAMTNDRPYRQALSSSHACKELLRCAGSQFDPYIVNQFIEMLADMNLYTFNADQAAKEDDAEVVKPMGLTPEVTADNTNCSVVKYTKYTLGKHNKILIVDDNFETLTGYTREDLETYNLTQDDLIFSEDLPGYAQLVKVEIEKNHEAFIEHRLRRKDGSFRRVLCDGREFFDPVSRELRVQIIATDLALSETVKQIVDKERDSQRRSHKRWEESVRKDPLTGILNRMAFQSDVSLSLLKQDRRIVLIMCDLDYFKTYNDTYGHQLGDELLISFARTLQDSVGHIGFSGRMGGDEFAAMLSFDSVATNKQIETEIANIWDQLINNIKTIDEILTISLGVAISSGKTTSFDELYKQADKALYQAKENGRNGYTIIEVE